MGLLHLHPSARHVEEALGAILDERTAAGAGAAVVLGQNHTSARELLERAWAARPRPIRVGPLGERLLVDAVAGQAAGGLGALAGSRGFSEALRGIFHAFRSGGLAPEAVRELARRSGPSAARVGELAALYGDYVARLGDRADEGEVRRAALRTLADGEPVRALDGVTAVCVHAAAADAAVFDVVEALGRRGLPVTVELPLVAEPGAPRPLLERAVEPMARRIEELTELPVEPRWLAPAEGEPAGDEERGAEEAPAHLGRLVGQLFRRAADPRRQRVAEAPVEVVAAPSPDAEARLVARRVRDRLAEGAAPGSIAVVVRDPSQRDRVERWLLRYGVPVATRPGRPALSSVPLRLVLRLGDLCDEEVPREELIALVSSRYVDGWIPAAGELPAIAPHRIARALREAGVRDDRPEEGVPGYQRRLGELARASDGPRRREVERIAARVARWLGLLGELPRRATLAAHAAALGRVVDALGIPLLARGYLADAEAGLDDAEQVAHDQAAVAALGRLLADLPRAANRAGLGGEPLERRRFFRLLEGALAGESVRPGGARGGAVELTVPEALAGRRFEHVFGAGLVDGALPARAAEDPLLHDDDRHRLNQLARPEFGRDLLERAAARDEREPLAWLWLCAAARRSLHLSFAAADESGRPLLPSPYLEEIARATGREPDAPAPEPVPPAPQCRLPGELRARAALEAEGPRGGRLGQVDEAVSRALLDALRAEGGAAWAALATAAAIERDRLAFFDGLRAAGRYDGRIADASLLAALAPSLPGSKERPLSASAVEDFARCGFRFFAQRVLAVEPPEESGDELDALAGGRLHHRVLERFYRQLVARGRLPLGADAEDLALLDETVASVLAEWEAGEARGHPALFAVRGQRVRREVERLLRTEAAERFFAPHRPHLFEHRFEAEVAAEGGGRLHLRGTIDRVDLDRDGGSAVVIDYKTGRASGYRKLLGDDVLLVTSFQLPIYAAALQREQGLRSVSACYLALRDAQPTRALSTGGRIVLDEPAPGEPASGDERRGEGASDAAPTLGAALRSLHRAMREGRFSVAPRSCDFCSLGAACRVVLRRTPEAEGGEGAR